MPRFCYALRHREHDDASRSPAWHPDDPTGVIEECDRLRRMGLIDANGNPRVPIEPVPSPPEPSEEEDR